MGTHVSFIFRGKPTHILVVYNPSFLISILFFAYCRPSIFFKNPQKFPRIFRPSSLQQHKEFGDPLRVSRWSPHLPKAASTHLEVAPCFRCDLAALSDKHLAHLKVRGCGAKTQDRVGGWKVGTTTVEGSEIRRSPVDMVVYPIICRVSGPSQVVVWDFLHQP